MTQERSSYRTIDPIFEENSPSPSSRGELKNWDHGEGGRGKETNRRVGVCKSGNVRFEGGSDLLLSLMDGKRALQG